MPEGTGDARAAFITALADLGVFYETHPRVPLPGRNGQLSIPIHVPGTARGARVEALKEIGELIGTGDPDERNGMLITARPFGPLLLEAHLFASDYTRVMFPARDTAAGRVA